MPGPLVVVGDTLLDRDLEGRAERLCPDAPAPVVEDVTPRERPGGAGLAAALLAADGREVTLITALGDDDAGRRVLRDLLGRGVTVIDLGRGGATPEKVRVLADGHVVTRIDHGGPPPGIDAADPRSDVALRDASAILVSDYGRGITACAALRESIRAAPARVLWDPHPRGSLPPPGTSLVTPNAAEAARLGDGDGHSDRALSLIAATGAEAVAVTLGADGAVLIRPGTGPLTVPAEAVRNGDPCGAGDRLASAAAAAFADGADVADAVVAGVRAATDFVREGGARALPGRRRQAPPPVAGPIGVAASVRARGGRVIAAGGCFDLLHAGHVSMLEAARALGDCLIVLMNSDDSVRRLKGPDRPLVGQEDRARVLSALACVDGVLIFDEDTPEAALMRLSPDVFAKGGDHDPDTLPEAAAVRARGGRVVALPYIAGRSTTRLIQEATQRVG
jgi:D-beta-D-heptose 7-phosphate kinase / D-beta-D-heptose 1-phosphate adenosyltransferase